MPKIVQALGMENLLSVNAFFYPHDEFFFSRNLTPFMVNLCLWLYDKMKSFLLCAQADHSA